MRTFSAGRLLGESLRQRTTADHCVAVVVVLVVVVAGRPCPPLVDHSGATDVQPMVAHRASSGGPNFVASPPPGECSCATRHVERQLPAVAFLARPGGVACCACSVLALVVVASAYVYLHTPRASLHARRE